MCFNLNGIALMGSLGKEVHKYWIYKPQSLGAVCLILGLGIFLLSYILLIVYS